MEILTLKNESTCWKRNGFDGSVDFTGFQHENGKVFDGRIEEEE